MKFRLLCIILMFLSIEIIVTYSHQSIQENSCDKEGNYEEINEKTPRVSIPESTQTPIKSEALFMEPEMVYIAGGTFQMGSIIGEHNEKPVHITTVSSFYIGKYEVTNAEYCAFLNSEGNKDECGDYWFNPKEYDNYYCGIENPSEDVFKAKPDYEHRPMTYVTWYGAVAYCNWLSEQNGLQKCYGEKDNRGNVKITKNGYRLPTEAEWEYACRGGTMTMYYWGDKMNDAYCWYLAKYRDEQAHPVGQKLPNALGLYDMSGNVWEWCSDWYGDYLSDSIGNPTGNISGAKKVLRGGSWYEYEYYCRSAYRANMPPDCGNALIGFRVVRAIP